MSCIACATLIVLFQHTVDLMCKPTPSLPHMLHAEFNALFMQLLERCLKGSTQPTHSNNNGHSTTTSDTPSSESGHVSTRSSRNRSGAASPNHVAGNLSDLFRIQVRMHYTCLACRVLFVSLGKYVLAVVLSKLTFALFPL